MESGLDAVWHLHQESVRRVLVSLARDLDLADDLVQETYLRARAGFAGYRGANDRAWLHTIARNTFFSHIRRAYIRSEMPLNEDLSYGDALDAGSTGHIDRLDLDRTLAELPSALQSALVMKYIGGHSYAEIAEHSNICLRTAKSRVEKAAIMIRRAFDENCGEEARCAEFTISRLLDYVYNLLPPGRHAATKNHINTCGQCAERVHGIRDLLHAFELRPGSSKMAHFVDIGRDAVPGLDVLSAKMNCSDTPIDRILFYFLRNGLLRSLAVPGKPLHHSLAPSRRFPDKLKCTAQLPYLILPGQLSRIRSSYDPNPDRSARRIGKGIFRFSWDQMPNDERDTAYTQVFRLPAGAEILACDPGPTIVTNGTKATIAWHSHLSPGERFHSSVEYRL